MSVPSGGKIETWGWIQAAIPEIQATLEPQDAGEYQVRLARTGKEGAAACRLRFRTFNLETQGGLEAGLKCRKRRRQAAATSLPVRASRTWYSPASCGS